MGSRLCLHLCLRLRLRGNVDKPGAFPLDGRVITIARLDRVDHSCSFSQADESQLAGYQPGRRSKSSSTSGGDEGNTGNGTRFRGGCERPRSSAGRGSGLILMGEVTKEGQLDKQTADREAPPATRRSRRALEYTNPNSRSLSPLPVDRRPCPIADRSTFPLQHRTTFLFSPSFDQTGGHSGPEMALSDPSDLDLMFAQNFKSGKSPISVTRRAGMLKAF